MKVESAPFHYITPTLSAEANLTRQFVPNWILRYTFFGRIQSKEIFNGNEIYSALLVINCRSSSKFLMRSVSLVSGYLIYIQYRILILPEQGIQWGNTSCQIFESYVDDVELQKTNCPNTIIN